MIGSYTASTGFARFPGTYSYRAQVSNPAAALVPKAENYVYVCRFLRLYVRLSMASTPVTSPIPRSLPSTFTPQRVAS